MAQLLWGQVYFPGNFAGSPPPKEHGDRCSFTYDPSFLSAQQTPIAPRTLPCSNLHTSPSRASTPSSTISWPKSPWLEEAQTRLLGKRQVSRFELLLAFGQDCAAWVSHPGPHSRHTRPHPHGHARPQASRPCYQSPHSSLGIQPKFTLIEQNGKIPPRQERRDQHPHRQVPLPRPPRPHHKRIPHHAGIQGAPAG